jgi:hypothetical protein
MNIYAEIFERMVLRRIYDPIKENCVLRSRYNHELYKLYNAPDIAKSGQSKWSAVKWLRHLRMKEQNPCRKLTLHKPEGTRRAGRPAVGKADSVEEDLMTVGARNWRRKSQDRNQWRVVVNETLVHHGL